MKFRQVEYAVEVGRLLSFQAAAERCNAAQPTLSNGIAALEQELGGRLFERTTREVRLTEFGVHLLPHLEELLSDRDAVFQAAKDFNAPTTKMLRIGMSPLIDLRALEERLGPFRASYPDVTIVFKECLMDDLEERLLRGNLDMGLRAQDVVKSGFQAAPAYSEPLVYLPQIHGDQETDAKNQKWRLGALPPAPIICTNGACGLNGALQRLMISEGLELNLYPGFALSYHIIEEWTELGVGAAILPASKASARNEGAGPLLLSDGSAARFSYEWIYPAASLSTTLAHVRKFREHVGGVKAKA